MIKIVVSLCLVFASMALMRCSVTASNPYEDPANVKLYSDQSLSTIKDSLVLGKAYPCSVAVYLPSLIDSLLVRISVHGADSVVKAMAVSGASPITFSYVPEDTGSFSMQIVIIKTNNTKDSLAQRKQFRVMTPLSCKILTLKPSSESLAVAAVAYPCTVLVSHPSLADSFAVRCVKGARDSLLASGTHIPTFSSDTGNINFKLAINDSGAYRIRVYVFKNNVVKDSLVKTVIGYTTVKNAFLSFKPSADSLVVAATPYLCTAFVFHPALSESFTVIARKGAKDTVLAHGKQIPSVSPDTGVIVFPLSIASSGVYTLRVYTYQSKAVQDSLIKTITGYSIPIVTPLQGVYHTVFGDSLLVRFLVTAVDSNLYGYSTFLSLDADTTKSHRVDVMYSITSRVGSDTITRLLRRPMLREGLSAPFVCYAQAVTRNYAFSTVASCTVYVADTSHPRITLLPPHINPVDSIINLPDSIIVKAVDEWAIDSVKINGAKMSLKSELLGQYVSVFSSLPQGTTIDTIIAWDKARNSDTAIMTLKYGGPATYPPKIKNLNRIVREGRAFDTLFLDTCITVSDPDIAANPSKDSAYRRDLTWTITDSAGNTVPYNTLTRKFVVPVKADSEWVDTFNLNFKVITKTGLPASSVGTFMVYEVPDPPKITLDSLHRKLVGATFDTLFLDTCATDPDNASSTLTWKFKIGKYFHVDSIMSAFIPITHGSSIIIRPRYFTRKIVIAPDTAKIAPATWTGSDTMTFTVTDPTGLSQSKRMIFTKFKIIIHSGPDAAIRERPIQ